MNEYLTSSQKQYSSLMGERSICYCVAEVNPDLFRPNKIHPDPIRPNPVQSSLIWSMMHTPCCSMNVICILHVCGGEWYLDSEPRAGDQAGRSRRFKSRLIKIN